MYLLSPLVLLEPSQLACAEGLEQPRHGVIRVHHACGKVYTGNLAARTRLHDLHLYDMPKGSLVFISVDLWRDEGDLLPGVFAEAVSTALDHDVRAEVLDIVGLRRRPSVKKLRIYV